MIANRRFIVVMAVAAGAAWLPVAGAGVPRAAAQGVGQTLDQTVQAPAYEGSPFHGARDGNGRIIPCRCRFQGREFRLGETVCMATPVGTVITRCDLLQNNTSWVPTGSACTISRAPGGLGARG
jgi:hypothetical protein